MRIDDGAHAGIEGHAAEVLEPCDAHTFEAAVERPREHFAGLVDGERRVGIGSGDGAEREGQVGYRPSEASAVQRVDQPKPALGLGTRPIEGRKPTTLQKAAGLRSEPPVSEPLATGTMPQASATAAPPEEPPQVLRQVVGIVRRAEDSVECLRAGAEFGRVGFADDDGAGAPHALDDDVVFGGDVVLVERRAEGGADAAGLDQVLVGDGQAVQRAQRLAARLHLVGLGGGFGSHLGTRVTIALTLGLTRSICLRCSARPRARRVSWHESGGPSRLRW